MSLRKTVADASRVIAACLSLAVPVALATASPSGAEEVRRTAILCAYEPEWQALLPAIADQHEESHAGVIFVTGRIEGQPVVLVESGVSMVNAALAAQMAIDRFKVERLIVMGISGGANPDLHIGDVVIPGTWSEYLESVFAREHDGRYALPNYFAVPQAEHFGMIFPQPVRVPKAAGAPELRRSFPADTHLLDVARTISSGAALATCTAAGKCLSSAPRLVVGGKGASGQAFIDNAEFRRFARAAFDADVLDMEAAAVAHVSYLNGVPFMSIRSLSDLAGGDAGANQMEAFQDLASTNAVIVLKRVLEQLHGS